MIDYETFVQDCGIEYLHNDNVIDDIETFLEKKEYIAFDKTYNQFVSDVLLFILSVGI